MKITWFIMSVAMWTVATTAHGWVQLLLMAWALALMTVYLTGAVGDLFPQMALHERILRRVAGKPLRKGELPASRRKPDWDAIEEMCAELKMEPAPRNWDD